MDNIADSLAWPTRDPQWFGKVLLIGLIALIPIVGGINAYGWMLAALDNLRAGRSELPPAGFQYLGRGISVWLVLFLWAIAFVVVIAVLFIIGGSFATIGSSQNSGGVSLLGGFFFLLGYLATTIASIGTYFLLPPLIVATEQRGVAGGLSPGTVFGLIAANPGRTVLAGLMVLVASVIASLGLIVCFIGVIFTSAYAYAVIAAVVSHYERGLSSTSVQPPAAPAV